MYVSIYLSIYLSLHLSIHAKSRAQYSQIEEGKNADPQISAVKVMEDEGGKSEVQEMEFVPSETVEDKAQASGSKQCK